MPAWNYSDLLYGKPHPPHQLASGKLRVGKHQLGAAPEVGKQEPIIASEGGRIRLRHRKYGGIVNGGDLAGRHGGTGIGQIQEQPASGVPGKLELLPQLTSEAPYPAHANPLQAQVEGGVRRRQQRNLEGTAVQCQLPVQGADQLARVPLNPRGPL
jgi:hypothetical protein